MTWEPSVGLHPDVPNDTYHAQGDWWSSTQLKRALPEQYKDESDWSSPALAFGTLVHTLVLEPERADEYMALDPAKVGLKDDGTAATNPTSTKAWKQAVAEVERDGKILITPADWTKANRMTDAVRAHPHANELLFQGEGAYELSAFARDERGIGHKARFDRLIPGVGVDLKTTSSKPGPDSLVRSVLDYGYEVSASHYLTVGDLLELDLEQFALVFVDKSDQPRVTVAYMDSDLLARGRVLRDRALERLTSGAERYVGATEPLTLACPPWARLASAETTIPSDFTWSINDYS